MLLCTRNLLVSLLLINGFSIRASDTTNLSPVLDKETLENLYINHVATLSYTDITHDPFVITFSGVPGMGKSYISTHLAEHYQAVCISSDKIREQLAALGLDGQTKEKALREYFFYLFERYDRPNKRIILDASIDRNYVIMFPYLKRRSIPFLVIRLEVPREVVIERILHLYGAQADNYLQHLDRWFKEYEEFASAYTDYIVYNNSTDASLQELIEEIDNHLIKN